MKEDYYTSAVDRQGSHFEFLLSTLMTLIGFVIAALGFVSFRFIDKKIQLAQDRWETKITEQEKINSKFLLETSLIKADIYFQLAVTLNKLAIDLNVSDEDRLNIFLGSLLNFVEAYSHESNPKKIGIVKARLNSATKNCIISSKKVLRNVNEIEGEERTKLIEKIKNLILVQKATFLEKMHLVDDDSFKEKSVEFIALLNKIIAKINLE